MCLFDIENEAEKYFLSISTPFYGSIPNSRCSNPCLGPRSIASSRGGLVRASRSGAPLPSRASSSCIFSKTRRRCPTFGTRRLPPRGLPLFSTGFWPQLYLVDISSVSRRSRSKLMIAPIRSALASEEEGISRARAGGHLPDLPIKLRALSTKEDSNGRNGRRRRSREKLIVRG